MTQEKSAAHRPTIYDVAERAGVAISTVSRVLNNAPDVSDATRERVRAAIEALQFRPDRTAKSLAQRQTATLAIAVPNFTTAFHNELLKGVRHVLREAEADLLVCDLSWAEPKASLMSFLQRGAVDGLLLVGLPVTEHIAPELKALGAPVVLVGYHSEVFDSFYWDEVAGARLAVAHLIERGHTRIGMITAHLESYPREARLQGYQEALEAAGLPFDEALLSVGRTEKHAGFSEESGQEAMEQLLAADPPVTAVFASSDVQALGAWKAIYDAGRSIPGDIALIGYDDVKASRFIGLTTVAQNMHDVGIEAAQLLLRRVARAGDAALVARRIEPRLMARNTT